MTRSVNSEPFLFFFFLLIDGFLFKEQIARTITWVWKSRAQYNNSQIDGRHAIERHLERRARVKKPRDYCHWKVITKSSRNENQNKDVTWGFVSSERRQLNASTQFKSLGSHEQSITKRDCESDSAKKSTPRIRTCQKLFNKGHHIILARTNHTRTDASGCGQSHDRNIVSHSMNWIQC